MSPVQIVVVALVVAAAVLAAGVATAARRRSLRRRFGPEYDRAVAERNGRPAAERELRARQRRHAELALRPLSPASRAEYEAAWEDIQVRFVDAPGGAVEAADELLTRLIAERGYPTGDFDEQVAYLSVEHARTLPHYRHAHDVNLRQGRGEGGTEQLRQALVHYRALFAELLGDAPDGRPHERVATAPDNAPDNR
jgi:hypothetical protein